MNSFIIFRFLQTRAATFNVKTRIAQLKAEYAASLPSFIASHKRPSSAINGLSLSFSEKLNLLKKVKSLESKEILATLYAALNDKDFDACIQLMRNQTFNGKMLTPIIRQTLLTKAKELNQMDRLGKAVADREFALHVDKETLTTIMNDSLPETKEKLAQVSIFHFYRAICLVPMFYADNVLGRKGPLATVWLAAHYDRKLKKTQITSTNIPSSLRDIITGRFQEMALRLSGQLLLGFVKIFNRQAIYLYEDCSEALSKAKVGAKPVAVDMPKEHNTAALNAITVARNFSDLDIMIPEPDLDSLFTTSGSSQLSSTLSPSLSGKSPLSTSKRMHFDEQLRAAKASIDKSLVQSLDFGESTDLENWDPNMSQRTRKSSIEVGRDAVIEPFFSPSLVAAEEPSMIAKDISLPEVSYDYDVSMPMDLDVPSHTFDLQTDANISTVAEGEQTGINDAETVNLATIDKPKKAQKKKRALLPDIGIELSNEQFQANLRDQSEITVKRTKFDKNVITKLLTTLSVPDVNDQFNDLLASAFQSIAEESVALIAHSSRHKPTALLISQEKIDEQETTQDTPNDPSFELPEIDQIPDYDVPDVDATLNKTEEMSTVLEPTLNSPLATRVVRQENAILPASVGLSTDFAAIDTLSVLQALPCNQPADLATLICGSSSSKRVIAAAFYDMLILGSRGALKLSQDEAYGPISLITRDSLFAMKEILAI